MRRGAGRNARSLDGRDKYEDKYFVDEVTTIETLADALNGLDIHISENQEVFVKKTYDSVSGHDLYYTMLVSEFTETVDYAIETRIIVNEKYEFEDFVLDDSFATRALFGLLQTGIYRRLY